MKNKIVFIDDEAAILYAFRAILEELNCEVQTFTDPLEGERYAVANEFDLMIVDLRMPGHTGADITKAVREAKPQANVLVVTAHPTDPLAATAMEYGARAVVKKPFDVAAILGHLQPRGHAAEDES